MNITPQGIVAVGRTSVRHGNACRDKSRSTRLWGLFFVAILLITNRTYATPITENNWQTHPEITSIRALYASIEQQKDQQTYTLQAKRFEFCQNGQDISRALYTDNNKPRLYIVESGSEDSGQTKKFYYDKLANIRFAFISANVYNGTEIEHRIYFAPNGKRLWESHKRLTGEGWGYPQDYWPDKAIAYHPQMAFDAVSRCPTLPDTALTKE
jgi:hypothetical protein